MVIFEESLCFCTRRPSTTSLRTYDHSVTYPAGGRAGELHLGLSSLRLFFNYLVSLLSVAEGSSKLSFESKKFKTYSTFLSESVDVLDVKSILFASRIMPSPLPASFCPAKILGKKLRKEVFPMPNFQRRWPRDGRRKTEEKGR